MHPRPGTLLYFTAAGSTEIILWMLLASRLKNISQMPGVLLVVSKPEADCVTMIGCDVGDVTGRLIVLL